MTRPIRRAAAVALLALLPIAAACGDDDDVASGDGASSTTTAGAAAGTFPVTVDSGGTPLRIDERPARIVSLSPTATELLWAIGADEQVVAVDDQSDFPAGVPTTELSGFQPNIEAIAGYDPDLVVAANDTGDLVAGLEKLQIPTLLQPAAEDLDDVYEQVEVLGKATGHADAAAEVADGIRGGVAEITADVEERAEPLTYFHELDPTYYTVTSNTFIGKLYELAGLENIADGAQPGNEYPQLSAEAIVQADPDFVFLADTECCQQTPETVAARPGWAGISAVKEGRVVALGDDVASRWGPRVVDLLRRIVDAVAKVPAA